MRLQHIFYGFGLALTVGLAGCGQDASTRIETALAANDPATALEFAERALADEPTDSYINWLWLQSRFAVCAAEECFTNDGLSQASVTIALSQLDHEIPTNEADQELTISLDTALQNWMAELGQLPAHPQPQLLVWQAATEFTSLTQPLQRALSAQVQQDLLNLEPAAARTLLQTLGQYERRKAPALFAHLLNAYVQGETRRVRRYSTALRSRQDEAIPAPLLQALPLAYLQYVRDQESAAPLSLFIQQFPQVVEDLNLPTLFNDAARSQFAQSINHMANINEIQQLGLAAGAPGTVVSVTEMVSATMAIDTASTTIAVPVGLQVPDVTQLGLENPQTMVQLELAKLALHFDPAQPDVWRDLLPTLREATARTGDIGLLTDNINPQALPADVRGLYNQMLFDLSNERLTTGGDVLSLLEQIVVPPENGTAVEERRNTLLGQALTAALEQEDVDQVLKLVQDQPQVAATQRGALVPFLINALRLKWQENRFDTMAPLAEFLRKDLDVDFDLDSLIVQSFQEYVQTPRIAMALSASTPDILIQPSATVALDFGPKLDFMRTHFATRPEVVDNQLKTLIINARGLYGQPSVLWQLWDNFSVEQFPLDEREPFLLSAIQNSIQQDNSLSGAEVIMLGEQLIELHPQLPVLFLLNNALSRTENLTDSRELWVTLPESWLNTLRAVRPQFAAFMEAVDAFEANERSRAARLLSQISEPRYLQQARPFIIGYVETLAQNSGTYLNPQPDENNKIWLLEMSPVTDVAAAVDPSHSEVIDARDLLAVKLTITTAVGENLIETPETLTTDRGRVHITSVIGRLDPAELTITIDESEPPTPRLPGQFERLIANLVGLRLQPEQQALTAILANGEKQTLVRIRPEIDLNLFPNGTFGMTEQRTTPNIDTDHVLPVGSVISLSTDRQSPVRLRLAHGQGPIVYRVTGTVRHPASVQPLPLRGFYNPYSHSVNFAYRYPLGQGDIEALIRCQVVEQFIQCAGHNRHWARNRFAHVVRGTIAASSPRIREDTKRLPPPSAATPRAPAPQLTEEDLLEPPATPVEFDENELDEFEAMDADETANSTTSSGN